MLKWQNYGTVCLPLSLQDDHDALARILLFIPIISLLSS